MTTATLQLLEEHFFASPSNPSTGINYTHLNPGAQHTLIFCYGAGGRALDLTLYQNFTAEHADLSLLCIDRYSLPSPHSSQNSAKPLWSERAPSTLLPDLSNLTLELLDALQIRSFSVAAHSAGVYQMLDLVRASSGTDRIQHIFPLCTHIPRPFTASKVMDLLSASPAPIFRTITALDSAGGTFGRVVGKLFLTSPQNSTNTLVVTPDLQRVVEAYAPSAAQRAIHDERRRVDYDFVYTRLPDVTSESLMEIYRNISSCAKGSVVWFTTDGDVFFGPASARRLLDAISADSATQQDVEVEVVNVSDASHADILFRRDVWEHMYERITHTAPP